MTRNQTLALAIAAVVAALAAGWMLGRAGRSDAPSGTTAGTGAPVRKVLYYRNPMGLPDTSPVPKKDPMGMDYIPVYDAQEAPAAPGTVTLSPEKIQTLGVRTEAVKRSVLASEVRVSGTIEIDETRQYAIAPRFEGWVAKLYANQTGMRVRAGQPLLAVYSPQLVAAQQEYRLADSAAKRLGQSDPASAASMARLRDAARTRLRNWEIDDAQLTRLARTEDGGNLVLTSPASAVVIEKPVVQGARFEAGETILRLADLSTVWVMAKVPGAQAAAINVGQSARFESTTLPGRSFAGKVTFVQPVVDAATRTVGVRVALPNAEGELRPGLFGNVLLEQPTQAAVINVPKSALLDTGTRQLVLVQISPGRFSPREVSLGTQGAGRVEVLSGLAEGEQVVVSANFLIDAESNLQSALQGLGAHAGHGASATPADAQEAGMEPAVTPAAPAGHEGHRPAAQPDTPKLSPSPSQPPATGPSPTPDPHATHRAQAVDPHAAHRTEPAVKEDHSMHEGH
ncbi:efflux RND transporter periplasmic adaptor subunit [Aerolutibacter ruishenii]|uniref:Cu(I)/Ag(I) efflux system membrane fusion protein n=1 Tax=Aerolutibacter ruishenii TaxID=686800 RepID=A0A562LV49_9GAMM|nr:efflux RND transporter periplasmic adaptor subunit [Lysobacter ruishenii]TWI11495.1 Cu(I)/Ag(I) efflux system membrane fusion protein [Lysobacter ruishenii]